MAKPARPPATRLAPALALAALLGAAGCGSEADGAGEAGEAYAPVDPDAFEIGTGASAFEELGAGATVPIIAGSQGGYHVWLSVRCGACGPELILSYGVEDAETGALLSRPGLREWEKLEERDGWRQAVGRPAFLDVDDPSVFEGRRARLWITADGGDGTPLGLEAEAEVTLSGIEHSF